MKFIEIAVLFSILGLSAGSASPQFSWLRVQPQPLLKVTFPDGQEDLAVLKRFNPIPAGPNEREEDIDQCIFDGYLSEEKEVYVTVTGCPLSGNFDVQLRSSRLSHSMFSVTQGVVRQVPSIFGSSVPNRENVMTKIVDKVVKIKQQPQPSSSKDAVNPNGYVIPMKIRYDDNFAEKFGNDAVNTIRRVVAQAQNIWKWPSLTTSLTFNVDENIEHIPGRFVAENDIEKVAALSTDPKFNAYVYWAYRNDQPGVVGIAYVGSSCSPDVKVRTSLNEYMSNDLVAAQTFAHELGHNLGMSHDFLNDPNNKRTDSKGNACSGVGGVMDYYGDVNKWSTCSVEDITNYINSVSPFCLTPL